MYTYNIGIIQSTLKVEGSWTISDYRMFEFLSDSKYHEEKFEW